MLSASLTGRHAAAATAATAPRCVTAAAAGGRPAALAARRSSHATACTSSRCTPPHRHARTSVTAAAAKRGGGGSGRGRGGKKKAPEETREADLVDDVLFDDEEAGEADDLVAVGDAEVDAFERFTSDDDDDDLLGDEGAVGDEEGEEEDAWDAALDNFDETQDEKDLTPLEPVDSFRAEGLKLARVEAARADDVEVTDITPVDRGPRTDEDRMVTLDAADAARLRGNRASYTALKMDGCELLVSETADGLFDLTDTFVFDVKSDLFNRTGTDGPLPTAPARFQCVPWGTYNDGNILKMKDPETKVLKMYFVGVARGGGAMDRESDYTLDMEKVYCFDAGTRLLARSVVRRVGDNIKEPILRIRPEGITVEDVLAAPTPMAILAEDYWHNPVPEPDDFGYDPSKHSKEALRAAYEAMTGMSREEMVATLQAAMEGGAVDGAPEGADVIVGSGGDGNKRIEDGDELDGEGYYEMPDVPAVDMM